MRTPTWFAHQRRLLQAKPQRYAVPPPQPLRGAYARNERLAQLERFAFAKGADGPESLAVDRDGTLVTGFQDGGVRRFDTRGQLLELVVHTGGHPLGLRFHPDGSLLICDATRGLLRHRQGMPLEVLADRAEGSPIAFADDLDIDESGRHVYFSDACAHWHFGEDQLAIVEHAGNGRLLHFDMETRRTRVLVRNLQFANGVCLGPHDEYVLVTETGGFRVHRHFLKGPRRGQTEVWLDNLPGYPDNIRHNGKGRFWLAIPVPRNTLADLLAPLPALRWGLIQLSPVVRFPIAHAAIALCFDDAGHLVANLQSHAADCYSEITQVMEHEQTLYVSSFHRPSLARMPLGAALPS
ncbi:MAG: hypothetical protein RL385_5540 [Pseudomonadota bacterium]|jgi:sugar lactone lactonase YvrE